MNNYVGSRCPVCNQQFTKDDDIVVCPICGTPHHRECYAKTNHCAFESEHASGKEWKPNRLPYTQNNITDADNYVKTNINMPVDVNENYNFKICGYCGHKNPSDNIFCCECGHRLSDPVQKDFSTGSMSSLYEALLKRMNPEEAMYGGVNPNQDIGGVTAKEYSAFIGKSSSYYLPYFEKIQSEESTSKISFSGFNVGAFLFGYLYFFYRKMYKLGFVLIAIFIALQIPDILYTAEMMPEIFRQSITISSSSSSVNQFDSLLNSPIIKKVLAERISNIDYKKAANYEELAGIASIISYVLRFAIGFFANYLYYKHSRSKIKEVNAIVKEENPRFSVIDIEAKLKEAGGTNKGAVIAVLVSFAVVYMGYIIYYYYDLLMAARNLL